MVHGMKQAYSSLTMSWSQSLWTRYQEFYHHCNIIMDNIQSYMLLLTHLQFVILCILCDFSPSLHVHRIVLSCTFWSEIKPRFEQGGAAMPDFWNMAWKPWSVLQWVIRKRRNFQAWWDFFKFFLECCRDILRRALEFYEIVHAIVILGGSRFQMFHVNPQFLCMCEIQIV